MRNSWPTSLFRTMVVLLCGLTSLVPILGQETAGAPVAANAQTDGLVDDSTYISLATAEQYTWSESWAYDELSSPAESDGEVIALVRHGSGPVFVLPGGNRQGQCAGHHTQHV
jgi:hypothetical protein